MAVNETVNVLKELLNKLSSQDTSSSQSTSSQSTLPPPPPPPPLSPPPSNTSEPIYKPNKRYVKVEEILNLMNLEKNAYNNLLVSKKYIYLKILIFLLK